MAHCHATIVLPLFVLQLGVLLYDSTVTTLILIVFCLLLSLGGGWEGGSDWSSSARRPQQQRQLESTASRGCRCRRRRRRQGNTLVWKRSHCYRMLLLLLLLLCIIGVVLHCTVSGASIIVLDLDEGPKQRRAGQEQRRGWRGVVVIDDGLVSAQRTLSLASFTLSLPARATSVSGEVGEGEREREGETERDIVVDHPRLVARSPSGCTSSAPLSLSQAASRQPLDVVGPRMREEQQQEERPPSHPVEHRSHPPPPAISQAERWAAAAVQLHTALHDIDIDNNYHS